MMYIIICLLLLNIIITINGDNTETISDNNVTENSLNKSNNKKILHIKNIPGYPGLRSDLYQVYMEPYYFYIGRKAVAEIRAYKDKYIIQKDAPEGQLMFQQLPEGMKITGTINGLSPGVYRLHINEKGLLLSKGCQSSGVNYNPYKVKDKDSEMDPLRDIGDLGDIKVEDKTTTKYEINLLSKYLTLTGPNGAIGRTVVVEKIKSFDSNESYFPICGIIGIA